MLMDIREMSNAGKKLIAAAQDAVAVAKCSHAYVEGAVVDGMPVLRCMLCKAIIHVIKGRK
jgi:hypothetical protein